MFIQQDIKMFPDKLHYTHIKDYEARTVTLIHVSINLNNTVNTLNPTQYTT